MKMVALCRRAVRTVVDGGSLRFAVVVLALCFSLAPSGAAWAITMGPRDAGYTPGATSQVPIVVELGSETADRFAFTITVTPNGSAPALSSNLGFTAVDVDPPGYVSPTKTNIRVMWLSQLSPAVTGTLTLGNVSVPIPAAASASDSYTVSISNIGVSLGGDELPQSAGPSITLGGPTGPPVITISITLQQLGVDVAPTSWALGVVGPGDSISSWLSGNEGHFAAENTGNVAEDFTVSASTSSPSGWTPSLGAPGVNQYVICYGIGESPYTSEPTWTCFGGTPVAMDGPVAADEYLPFDLRFTAPTTDSSGAADETFVISLAAAAN